MIPQRNISLIAKKLVTAGGRRIPEAVIERAAMLYAHVASTAASTARQIDTHADNFLQKGALLFTLWYDMPHRWTRDVDLLGFGSSDLASIERTFRKIAAIEADDGMVFHHTSIKAQEIRKETGYVGARVIIAAELARARCKAQVDIGFGDAVTPGPASAVYPVLIADFPAPRPPWP